MDILEIVNSFIKNKQELNLNNIDFDTIADRLNNQEPIEKILGELNVSDEFLKEILLKNGYMFDAFQKKWQKKDKDLPFSILLNIVSSMYNEQLDLKTLALKYLTPEEIIIKELKKKKFRYRWAYTGESASPKLSPSLRSYLNQLNNLNKDIKEIAEIEGTTVIHIETELKKANYKKIWMLEETFLPPYGISSIDNKKLIYYLDTGEPIVLLANGRILFTMKQVSNILNINSKYVFNRHYKDFKENMHFIIPKQYLGNNLRIFSALPHIDFLAKDVLFTDRGLYLLSVRTETVYKYHKKIKEIEDILLAEKQKIKQNPSITVSEVNFDSTEKSPLPNNKTSKNKGWIKSNSLTCDEIIKKLNEGKSLKDIEEESHLYIAELNNILEGYRYDDLFKIWTNKSRKDLLDKIANEIISNRSSIENMAKLNNITKLELIENLILVGYNFKYDNWGYKLKTEKEIKKSKKINENKNENSTAQRDDTKEEPLESKLPQNLSQEELVILKELLSKLKIEKENSSGKTGIDIYLNKHLYEEIEAYSEINNITKSILIQKALEHYLFLGIKEKDGVQVVNEDNSGNVRGVIKKAKGTYEEEAAIKDMRRPDKKLVPSEWDDEKQKILISAIIDGTREGRTLNEILEEISNIIGISVNKCHSHWYTKVPQQYRDTFKQIKREQESNWSIEDFKMLEYIVTVEYAHLSIQESIPIASKRLKRHVDIVRKKWNEKVREK